MPLTDTECRTAKPKEKPYKLTDGNGLYLEVKPNGVKAWRYRFELNDGTSRKERAAPDSMRWAIQQTGSKDSSPIPSKTLSAAPTTMPSI